MKRNKNVFTFKGGGLMGVVSLTLAKEFQKQTEHKIRDIGDEFYGTSTGSIIAAAYACGFTTDQLLNLYQANAKTIFKKSRHLLAGYKRPKYKLNNLIKVLDNYFGSKTFGTVHKNGKRLVINAMDFIEGRNIEFDSNDPYHHNIRLVDAIASSCAAPTYFSAHSFTSHDNTREWLCIDGGLTSKNDPCDQALSMSGNNINLFSFGTGALNTKYSKKLLKKLKNGGIIDYAPHIFFVILEQSSEASLEAANLDNWNELNDKDTRFRFDVPLPPYLDEFDNPKLIDDWIEVTKSHAPLLNRKFRKVKIILDI